MCYRLCWWSMCEVDPIVDPLMSEIGVCTSRSVYKIVADLGICSVALRKFERRG